MTLVLTSEIKFLSFPIDLYVLYIVQAKLHAYTIGIIFISLLDIPGVQLLSYNFILTAIRLNYSSKGSFIVKLGRGNISQIKELNS